MEDGPVEISLPEERRGVREGSEAIDFPVWMEYTRFLRGVSADAGVSMRTLDRALWQYSKVKG